MDLPEWIRRAKSVETVGVDLAFLVAETFYYGPDNGFTQEQRQKLREPLYKPKVDRYGDFILSAELGESPAELIQHYRDVLRLSARHGKEIGQKSHYFWIRPLIFARGQFAMTFPWYDTGGEAIRLLDALSAACEGQLFFDVDQGWEFEAFRARDRLFLRQGDPDSGEEQLVIATNHEHFVAQIPAARERISRLLQELTQALGSNYWCGSS